MFDWLFKKKKHKHKWETLRTPFVAGGKVYVVECCRDCGMYQYVRVPSNRKREELEANADGNN